METKMTYSKFESGSEWRRWDLHVHTKGTLKNDQFTSESFDEYCRALFTKAIEHEIAVIGITDYFSIENYKRVLTYQSNVGAESVFSEEEKQQIKSILLIPSMELRMLPTTDSGRLVNIHMLINPIFVERFENYYLPKITLSSSEDYSLTKYNLINYGLMNYGLMNPSLDKDAKLNKAEVNYKKGVKYAAIEAKTLHNLKKENFDIQENVIFALSNSSHDGASGFQEHFSLFENESGSLDEVRKSTYHLSDLIFSSNTKDAEFFLGKKTSIQDVIEQCGGLKACLHGSDAHTEDKLFSHEQNRNCWIKADPTFEGLKQIIYEPDSRVTIQEFRPEAKDTDKVIKSFTTGDGQIIHFNSNLNTIIGGRSSGKSALLASIAYKCGKLIDDKTYADFLINQLEVNNSTIRWLDGQLNEAYSIEYFPQKYLYETQEKGLQEIIYPILEERGLTVHLQSLNIELEQISKRIADDVEQSFTMSDNLSELRNKKKELGNEDAFKLNIQQIEEQIQKINTTNSVSQEDQNYHSEKAKELEVLRGENQALASDLILLPSIKNALVFNSLDSSLNGLSQANREKIQQLYDDIVKESITKWESELEKIGTDASSKQLENNNKDQAIFKDEKFVKTNEKYAAMQELKPLQERLAATQKGSIELNSTVKNIEELEKGLIDIRERTKENWLKYKTAFDKCKEEAKLPADSGLEVKVVIKFQDKKFKSFIENSVNQRSATEQALLEFEYSDFAAFTDHIEQLVGRAEDSTLPLKGGYANNYRKFVKDLLTPSWHEIDYDVSYEQDDFSQMSEGKKAFVVLRLILEFSKRRCPILIDQPEDDLDNRAIFKELVTFLKTQKSMRQIILVSHNANVVVNADSELVIVANQHGSNTPNTESKKFEYVTGSLEFSKSLGEQESLILYRQGIKEHVCDVLEGGNEAFKRRERKYSIK